MVPRGRRSWIEGGKLGGLSYAKDAVTVVLLGAETDPAIVSAAVDLACAAASSEVRSD